MWSEKHLLYQIGHELKKIKKMKWLIVFSVICLNYKLINGIKGATQVDKLRTNYYVVEKNLWDIVNSNKPKDDILEEIHQKHKQFYGNEILKDFRENDFYQLNHFYDWKYLEVDLLTITNLFTEFKKIIERQLVGGFDQTVGTDLAETVLKDGRWPVPELLDGIDNVMVKQGLYYKTQYVIFKIM